MNTTISAWGNSSAIRIPRNILDEFGGTIGTEIKIELKNDALILKKKASSLDDLLEKISAQNLHQKEDITPIGKEIW